MKYYAVKNGRKKGIFKSWDECKESIDKFPNAIYKSFSSLEDAKIYLNGEDLENQKMDFVAYVDGSFNKETFEYSFGALIFLNGKEFHFKKKFGPDDYSQFRNVAGEVRGASFIIEYAIRNNIKVLDLYYDYMGIEKWYLGLWKANNDLTKKYQEFAVSNQDKIEVRFHKVKSHTNDKYNDLVDRLAKEALGI